MPHYWNSYTLVVLAAVLLRNGAPFSLQKASDCRRPFEMKQQPKQQQYTRRIPSCNMVPENSRSSDITSIEGLSPLESWCVLRLETLYAQALSIRCPFFKRRASDILDALDQIMRFVVIRHKSLPLVAPPAGWRCQGDLLPKSHHLSSEELLHILRSDWKEETNRGYYITGRLNTTVYADHCLFDGPDPDMPVRGLRKYLDAASQLFDPVKSRAELLSLDVVEPAKESHHHPAIVATWRMKGVLRLPWKPNLPEWTGTTTYHRDENGLIFQHVESWDMSTFEAFVKTFSPPLAEQLWPVHSEIQIRKEP